jgi:hypothetical protein
VAAGAGCCTGAVVGVGAKSSSELLHALAITIPMTILLSNTKGHLANHPLIIAAPPC